MDYTAATRKSTLEKANILHVKKGDSLYAFYVPEIVDVKIDEFWLVFKTIRHGLTKTSTDSVICYSEAEANGESTADPSDYMEVVGGGVAPEVHEHLKTIISGKMASYENVFLLGNIGDHESPLAFEILSQAGICEWGNGPSEKVQSYLGLNRVDSLKSLYGENWACAAVFEYCWINLPHSSAAFAAAAFQYHYYIAENDLFAGYYWRDMELAASGAEAIASKELERKEKAGAGGKASSKESRALRIESLLRHMERVVKENPALARLPPSEAARLASEDASAENPTLWRQGAKQYLEYLGEISRGDEDGNAGPVRRKRFEVLFPPKPPKGSRSKLRTA